MGAGVSPNDVRKRGEVSKLASQDIERAIEVARSIQHPWYRCQALAYAAAVHPKRTVAVKLAEDAFRAAEEQTEINRIVTVSSWPLRVAVKLSPSLAGKKVPGLLALAAEEQHGLRRAHALSAILHAVADLPDLKAQVLAPLVDTLTAAHGWRIERLIAGVAMLVKHDHPEYVSRLLAAHPENRRKRKLVEALDDTRAA